MDSAVPGNCGYPIDHAADMHGEGYKAWYRLMLFDDDDHVIAWCSILLLINQVPPLSDVSGCRETAALKATWLNSSGCHTLSSFLFLELCLAESRSLYTYQGMRTC